MNEEFLTVDQIIAYLQTIGISKTRTTVNRWCQAWANKENELKVPITERRVRKPGNYWQAKQSIVDESLIPSSPYAIGD
jgi:hypothetical protein